MKKITKKGVFGLEKILAVVILIGIISLVAALLSNVQADVGDDFAAGTVAKNVSDLGLANTQKIMNKTPMLITAIAGVLVIGIVLAIFAKKNFMG